MPCLHEHLRSIAKANRYPVSMLWSTNKKMEELNMSENYKVEIRLSIYEFRYKKIFNENSGNV